ncbi:MAG: lipopolysaccharide kinase InaA family protein [Planctomycetota bacterium]
MEYSNLEAFESVKNNGNFYLIRKGYQDIIPKKIKDNPAGKTAQGRGNYNIIKLDEKTSAVIRKYKRGGLSGIFLPDIFWGDTRAIKELLMTEKALESEVPVPKILGIIIKPFFGPLCQLWIITRQIEAPTLAEYIVSLKNTHSPEELLAKKINMVKIIIASVRKLDQIGIQHRDLHIRNILIGLNRAYIIDFDGAKKSKNELAAFNILIRLNRSISKYLGNSVISASDRLRLLKMYFDADYFNANKKVMVNRCLKNLRWHQIWWVITGQK